MLNRAINRWWTVVAGMLGGAFGSGTIMIYSYGILSSAMGDELAWDRGVLGANLTAFLVGSGFGLITLGFLISRHGVRIPAAIFVSVFGFAFASIAALPPVPMLYQLIFFVVGWGGAAGTAMPYSVAIAGFFDARRGLALGLVVAGAGFGAAFGPPVTRYLVDHLNWQTAFVVIGLSAGLLPALGLLLLVQTPRGAIVSVAIIDDKYRPTPMWQVAVDPSSWKIVIPVLFVSLAALGGMSSLVPLAQDRGFSPSTIAAMLSVAGLASWVARPLVGYLLDKIFAPYVCAAIFLLAALGFVILIATSLPQPAFVGAALIGIALGTEADMVTFLISRYFKLIDYSRLIGLIWVVWAWGGGAGSFVAGRIYGASQSYQTAFLLFAALLLVAAVVICLLGPYRTSNPVEPRGL